MRKRNNTIEAHMDLTAVYENHRMTAYSVARSILRNHADAEDVMQESMLRLAGEDPPPDNPAAWLTTVAANICRDIIKSHRRRDVSLAVAVEPIAEADPLDALIAAEERELLTASIQRLPDAYRGVVQLAYVKGLGGIRIAEQLSLALGTVYNRMLSGRAKLREYTL